MKAPRQRGKTYGSVDEMPPGGWAVLWVDVTFWGKESRAWWHRKKEAAASRVRSLRAGHGTAWLEPRKP
jgi:hypothetical protein